jgi:branched-chain amino acid transport system permease protein
MKKTEVSGKSRWFFYAAATALLVSLPFYAGAYLMSVAGTILIYMALALSWDMLLRSGQLSFGIAGFFGIGGYATAIIFMTAGTDPLVSILAGGIVAALFAFFIGAAVLQLRGMYFAIVTLALSEIFRVIIRNLPDLTGGPEGLVLPTAIFAGDSTKTFWLILAVALGAVIASELFQKSRIFFALTSIRNDEILARSSGINVFKYLLFVFTLTSMIQGIAGGAYAQIHGFVSPEGSFSLDFALLPMAMALFGGMHTTWGPILGAVLLGIASEILKLYIPYGHLLVYGVIIVVAIILFPKGIVGTASQKTRTE